MTKRLGALFVIVAMAVLGTGMRLLAHAGHDHKVMGTVTMAAADHIMVKDATGKDVMIHVARTTKVKATPVVKVEDIKTGTRVVVTASMQKDVMTAKTIQVGAAPTATH